MPKLQAANPILMAPPTDASKTLSASNCPMMRPRSAPIAARTANSREREVARASSRFAMFAHTISNTNPSAPESIHSSERTSETIASLKERTTSGESGLVSSMPG